jgi:GH24 family phage-related lysozyme (muramidase)
MSRGDLTLFDQLLERVTDSTIEEALAYREDPAPPSGDDSSLESTRLPTNPRDCISKTAFDFIVRFETGGKPYYERVVKGRPVWPGFQSGITIGCGYDLGYHKLAAFQAEWSSRLPKADLDRLAKAVGFRTTEPGRAQKVIQAKALVQSLSDIVVPWDTAIEQFDKAKFPAFIKELYRALDNLDQLHPHCQGALLSLVFNRGAQFVTAGERYAEMRAIGELMREGSSQSMRQIPSQLRSMKRIWGDKSALAERRESEAKLFEAGLGEMRLLEGLSGAATLEAVDELPSAENHDDVEVEQTDIADEAELEAILNSGLEASGFSVNSVRWAPVDDEQPDYRHLDTRLAGKTFEFTPEDLTTLIAANAFQPLAGKVIFGLRGARLVGAAKRENVNSITVTDQRPDHRDFRCIVGIYDPSTRRLWAYQASTVPNAAYVFKCFSEFSAGKSIPNLTGNILLTGCYTMTVGTHRRGTPGEIPTVLRLSKSSTGASEVIVLRSLADVTYDRHDCFHHAAPGNNIHPGQLFQGFSSAGCITFPGRYASGRHTGSWGDFRTALGIGDQSDGRQFSLVLLTGLDAAMAWNLRVAGGNKAALARLRSGSKSDVVAKLQTALGLKPDPSQLIGPVTRRYLIYRQHEKLGWADGIYSAAMDQQLGLNVWPRA